MTSPLTLSIAARKTTYLAGEGIVIDIEHVVSADLDMETVELNRNRTSVVVTPLASPERAEVLTGTDHAQLHHIPMLQAIGSSFRAPAGSVFSSYLELAAYRKALPAGRYQVALRYRHGADPAEVTESNAIDIEVVPARTQAVHHRWLAGAGPRDELSSSWVVEDVASGASHWIYRAARKHDPSVIVVSTAFGEGRPFTSPPVIAHLNDIAPMHFARHVVWLEKAGLGIQKIHNHGAAGAPSRIPTGLAEGPAPAIVDPPLHRRDDGLAVVVLGVDAAGKPALACLDQPAEGAPRWKSLALPAMAVAHAAVLWDVDEQGYGGQLLLVTSPSGGKSRIVAMDLAGSPPRELFATNDPFLRLEVDQGLGRGFVLALTRGRDAFHSTAWAVETLSLAAEASFSFEAVALGDAPPDPVDAVVRSGEAALSLLFRAPDGWIVVHPGSRVLVPFDLVPADAEPRLVSTPRRGVFLLYPDASVGLQAVRAEP